jgi:hypothetical protein
VQSNLDYLKKKYSSADHICSEIGIYSVYW